jgi:two-component system sensor histidine kinase KdpD
VAGLGALASRFFNIESPVVLFVLAPVASALFFGVGPALAVSILSALVYDYLFTKPYFSLAISDPAIALEVAIFVAVSILTAQLAGLVRRQQDALSMRLGQTELLSDMGKELLAIPNIGQIVVEAAGPLDGEVRSTLRLMKTTVRDAVAGTVLRYADRALHLPCIVVIRVAGESPRVWARSEPDLDITPKDQAIVQWVFDKGQLAGRGTRVLGSSTYCFVPMSSRGACRGAIGIRRDFSRLLPGERALVAAVANLAAVTLENLEAQAPDSA